MKFELIIPEIVEAEIDEAAKYYDKKQDGLGNKLYNELTEALSFIEKNPLSFQKSRKEYRHALLVTFPYLIIFWVYENKILVYKFIHTKQHPAKRYKKR
jgi:hypothetical protein